MNQLKNIDFKEEFTFKTSRSGGKGGQNVNKVSTKVELDFNIQESQLLSEEQKRILLKKLDSRINKEGILQISVQSERSQLRNKEIAIQKFYTLLAQAFYKPKKRIATKPGKKAKEKRIQEKKIRGERKQLRKKWSSD